MNWGLYEGFKPLALVFGWFFALGLLRLALMGPCRVCNGRGRHLFHGRHNSCDRRCGHCFDGEQFWWWR